jgi:hypothetical protein
MYDRCTPVLLTQQYYGISMKSVDNLDDRLHDQTPQIQALTRFLHLRYDFRMGMHLHGVRILFNTMTLDT